MCKWTSVNPACSTSMTRNTTTTCATWTWMRTRWPASWRRTPAVAPSGGPGTTISPHGSSHIQQKRGDSTSAVSPSFICTARRPSRGMPRLVCGVPRQSGVSAAAPGAAHPCKTQETRPKAASLFFPHGRNSARYAPQQAEQQKKRYLPDFFRRRRPAAPLRLSTAAAA